MRIVRRLQPLERPLCISLGLPCLQDVAAETGVIMLIYLDQSWEKIKSKCRLDAREPTSADLYEAVMEGSVERVRPKMMTVVAIMAGLLPIMWGTGTGSEVMSRIAAPMVGGMISSTVLTHDKKTILLVDDKPSILSLRAQNKSASTPECDLP